MDYKDKKMAVLHLLAQEKESISMPKLLDKLGSEYTERSVRRWLSDMIIDGLIEKEGNKKGTKYRVIERPNHENEKKESCFGTESLKIIKQVRRPIYERHPIAYDDSWFDAYYPNVTYYTPLEFRIQLEKAGQRVKREDPAGTYAHQIFNRLLIDLSYNSSRLEGNTYSLLDTQRLLIEGSTAGGSPI